MKKSVWIGAAMAAAVTSGCVAVAPAASYGATVTVQAGAAGQRDAGGPGASGQKNSGEPGASGQRTEGDVAFHGPGDGVSGEVSGSMGSPGTADSGQSGALEVSFDVDRFVLPEEARVLVTVEGTGGSSCRVCAFEKVDGAWQQRLGTLGVLGANGMSSHRTEGDKTTPIGVFRMNTPFGQKEALEGFPANYIQVKENHVWSQITNRLVENPAEEGEHVGSAGYARYYDYVIDAGFNPLGLEKQGSALFFHCIGENEAFTSGCVAIPTDQMIGVMRLYGAYGDGACYAAQAPEGTFDRIYQSYGVNQGLSPDGEF